MNSLILRCDWCYAVVYSTNSIREVNAAAKVATCSHCGDSTLTIHSIIPDDL